MPDPLAHAPGVTRLQSIYAGPCTCGPAVHINMGKDHDSVTVTCLLSIEECEELIKQIRSSVRLVKRSQPSANQ